MNDTEFNFEDAKLCRELIEQLKAEARELESKIVEQAVGCTNPN